MRTSLIRLFLLFVLTLPLLVVVPARAQEDQILGGVNWDEGYVSAIGYGAAKPTGNKAQEKIMALRAAEVAAQRNLLEIIKGVRIDSVTRVENLMLASDLIVSRVDGVLKGAQVARRDMDWPDGSPLGTVEVRVCLATAGQNCRNAKSLTNALDLDRRDLPPAAPKDVFDISGPANATQAVNATQASAAPAVAKPETQAPAAAPAPVNATAPAPEPGKAPTPEPVKTPTPEPVKAFAPEPIKASAPEPAKSKPAWDTSKPVSGVVFALEGRFFERELLPVVVTHVNGKMRTVYSVKSVQPKVVRTYGVARYAESVEQALGTAYLGGNVMVVPVQDITKDNFIVINGDAARQIRESTRFGNNYLYEAKVMITAN